MKQEKSFKVNRKTQVVANRQEETTKARSGNETGNVCRGGTVDFLKTVKTLLSNSFKLLHASGNQAHKASLVL